MEGVLSCCVTEAQVCSCLSLIPWVSPFYYLTPHQHCPQKRSKRKQRSPELGWLSSYSFRCLRKIVDNVSIFNVMFLLDLEKWVLLGIWCKTAGEFWAKVKNKTLELNTKEHSFTLPIIKSVKNFPNDMQKCESFFSWVALLVVDMKEEKNWIHDLWSLSPKL